jgi:hypothetical protein
MATKKTHPPQTPSANGTKPPRHLETTPPTATDKTRKRAAARGPKTTAAAKTPKQAAVTETAPAKATVKPKAKKLSALDAAAKVLAETGQAMTCAALIEAMAAKGYWTSPGGKTPSATLYSAILRELKTKGANARFKKTDRGQFAHA